MKNIISKIYYTREVAGTTSYINEITDFMNRYYTQKKDSVLLFEPELYEGEWKMSIYIPGCICGEITVVSEGEGTLASIWKIIKIEMFDTDKFSDNHISSLIKKYEKSKLILPVDKTISKSERLET